MVGLLIFLICVLTILAIAVFFIAVAYILSNRPLEEYLPLAVGTAWGWDKKERGGRLRRRITATAFEREGDIYRFVTAAHCVYSTDDIPNRKVILRPMNWYITFEDFGKRKFYPARLVAAGYRYGGDDLAVFEAVIKNKSIPVIPLSASDPQRGEKIINVAKPQRLARYAGKLFLRGNVCSYSFLEEIVVGNSPNITKWKGAIYCQLIGAKGSSGSVAVSIKSKSIVAIIVGSLKNSEMNNMMIALPVSRFRRFWEAVKAGHYKPLQFEEDNQRHKSG